jgi:hypothetical protein
MLTFLSQICEEIGVKCPINIKLFTGKSKLLYVYSFNMGSLYNVNIIFFLWRHELHCTILEHEGNDVSEVSPVLSD